MAKTRRGSRKTSASSRAKGTKKASRKPARKSAAPKSKALYERKQLAPSGLDLKKLQGDITKAYDVLQKRLEKIDPESPQGRKLAETQTQITRWSSEIDSMCSSDPHAEPCGDTMLITS